MFYQIKDIVGVNARHLHVFGLLTSNVSWKSVRWLDRERMKCTFPLLCVSTEENEWETSKIAKWLSYDVHTGGFRRMTTRLARSRSCEVALIYIESIYNHWVHLWPSWSLVNSVGRMNIVSHSKTPVPNASCQRMLMAWLINFSYFYMSAGFLISGNCPREDSFDLVPLRNPTPLDAFRNQSGLTGVIHYTTRHTRLSSEMFTPISAQMASSLDHFTIFSSVCI